MSSPLETRLTFTHDSLEVLGYEGGANKARETGHLPLLCISDSAAIVAELLSFQGRSYTDYETLEQCVQQGPASAEFRRLLTDLANTSTPGVQSIAENTPVEAFSQQVAQFLQRTKYPHPMDALLETIPSRLDVVDFLIAEVQVGRILAAKASKGEEIEEMDVDASNEALLFSEDANTPVSVQEQLALLAEILELPTTAAYSAEQPVDLLTAAATKVTQLSLPPASPLWQQPLPADVAAKLNEINEALKVDYGIRRQMLLKRLDVTIQSLLWSDRLKENKTIHQIIRDQKHKILALGEPQHAIGDVFLAQDDLAEVRKTSSRTSVANTDLAKVVVGNITDRGGRVGEARRAAKIPGFKARSETADKHRAGDDSVEPKAKRAKTEESGDKGKHKYQPGPARSEPSGRGRYRPKGK